MSSLRLITLLRVSSNSRAVRCQAESCRFVSSSTPNDNPHAPENVLVPLAKEEGKEFRELFLMPKRKLQGQLTIERLTGRAEMPPLPQKDLKDRLAVRRPRHENMSPDQDWTAVWPAAASFRASVVPLPVRMGYRRNVERRPPFKTVGNLELMKIPNFLHLTPKHIKQHCEAIKKFCTEFPPELKAAPPELAARYFPVTMSYSDYVHQGTSLRDIRARVVTIHVRVDSFGLPDDDNGHAIEKLRRLVGKRYDPHTRSFTITADRCMTRKQNRDYVNYVLTALYHESCKCEPWEEQLRQRDDNIEVEFRDSPTERHIAEILAQKAPPDSDTKSDATDPDTAEAKVDAFAKRWHDYRNSIETPETVRHYEESVRRLLGIEKIVK